MLLISHQPLGRPCLIHASYSSSQSALGVSEFHLVDEDHPPEVALQSVFRYGADVLALVGAVPGFVPEVLRPAVGSGVAAA
jgi:hypothetical protein